MKAFVPAVLFLLSAANLPAQTSGSSAQSQKPSPVTAAPGSDKGESKSSSTFERGFLKTDFGFTSRYPTDWQDHTAYLAKQLPEQLKKLEREKDPMYMLVRRQLACTQAVLFLSRGNPPSLIKVVALPNSCTKMDNSESAFVLSAALGSCSVDSTKYNLRETLQGAYRLGKATLVIERAVGSPKDHPEVNVTLERVCGLLRNTKVFWEGELHDEEAVKVFEGALTSIDGEEPSPLVPASAIANLHRPYTGQKSPNVTEKKSTPSPH